MNIPEKVREFLTKGYAVLPHCIATETLDVFWGDVEHQISANKELTLTIYGRVFKNSEAQGDLLQNNQVLRIIDIEDHSSFALDLMFSEPIANFLHSYLDDPPTAIQTLTYKYGSQQGAHSDLHLVSPPTVGAYYERESLCAAWIACEDVDDFNGPLVIYPGSHRILKKTLRSFENDYGAWVRYLDTLCREHGCFPEPFYARKGDVLLWHGDLVHGGAEIKDFDRTRRSFVVHYARVPDNTPLLNSLRPRRARLRGCHFGLAR